MVSIKQYNTQSRISLEILRQCSSNLASGLYITKEAKWHLLCRCHNNSYAAGPVLIKTKIPRFYGKWGSSTHNNLLGIAKAIWEPCVCWARPSVPLDCKWGYYFVFLQKETGAESVAMAMAQQMSFYFFCDVCFWCQVWRTLLQYFWRYSWLSVALF